MKKILFFLFLTLTITSCIFKVIVNDKKHPFTRQKTKSDSILVFGIRDSVPDKAEFISNTKIYSGLFWGEATFHSPYYLMIDYAKTIAKELGANIRHLS